MIIRKSNAELASALYIRNPQHRSGSVNANDRTQTAWRNGGNRHHHHQHGGLSYNKHFSGHSLASMSFLFLLPFDIVGTILALDHALEDLLNDFPNTLLAALGLDKVVDELFPGEVAIPHRLHNVVVVGQTELVVGILLVGSGVEQLQLGKLRVAGEVTLGDVGTRGDLVQRSRAPLSRPLVNEKCLDALVEVVGLHELGSHLVFASEGVGNVPSLAEAHLTEGNMERCGGALVELLQGVLSPSLNASLGGFLLEGANDLIYGVVLEATVDSTTNLAANLDLLVVGKTGGEFLDGVVDDTKTLLHGPVVLGGKLGKAGFQGGKTARVNVVGGNAGVVGLNTLEHGAGKTEVGADLARHPGKEERSADVGEEANLGLGHGENGALGSDPEGGMDAESNTTSHGNAVEDGYVGPAVGGDKVVELVFEAEVVDRVLNTLWALGVLLGQGGNITTCAEGLLSSTLDDDDVGHIGLFPLDETGRDLADHGAIEGVELGGAVKLNGAKVV